MDNLLNMCTSYLIFEKLVLSSFSPPFEIKFIIWVAKTNKMCFGNAVTLPVDAAVICFKGKIYNQNTRTIGWRNSGFWFSKGITCDGVTIDDATPIIITRSLNASQLTAKMKSYSFANIRRGSKCWIWALDNEYKVAKVRVGMGVLGWGGVGGGGWGTTVITSILIN